MEILYFLIRKYKTLIGEFKSEGFNPREIRKQIKRDAKLGKAHYNFGDGNLGASVVRPDGQWDNDLPPFEEQKKYGVETFHCTCFGTENAIQILQKAKYGISEEYSERYCGVHGKINPTFGGSPHTVAEGVRKYGMLPYDKLPFDETIKNTYQFNSPNPMTEALNTEGRKWLKVWKFGHDWLKDLNKNKLMEALKTSPLGVGVYAGGNWASGGIVTKPSWATDNHWVVVYGYVQGQYWKVWDSYNGGFKKLEWNYNFKFAKRYTLDKVGNAEVIEKDMGEELLKDIKKRGIKYLQVVSDGAVYEIVGDDLLYHFWSTDSQTFFQVAVNEYIRAKEKSGKLIGITKENFEVIKNYVVLAGGRVVFGKDMLEELKAS